MSNWNAYLHPDGEPRPSVTSILGMLFDKPQLYYWFKKVPAEKAVDLCIQYAINGGIEEHKAEIIKAAIDETNKKRDAKGDIGSRLHKIIATILEGKTIALEQIDDDLKILFSKWDAWRKEHQLIPADLETVLFSDQYGHAGTGDFFGMYDGVFSYIDWKTGFCDNDIMPLQCAAYSLAYEEKFNRQIEAIKIVEIQKEGVKVHDYSDELDYLKTMWAHVMAIWAYRNRRGRKWTPVIRQLTGGAYGA